MIVIIESIVIALLVVKYQRLKLKPFIQSWNMYALCGLLLLYIGLTISTFLGFHELIQYRNWFQCIVVSVFAFMAGFNNLSWKRIITSLGLLLSGGFLNRIAINLNNGKMPVFPSLSISTGYISHDMLLDMTKFSPVHTIGNYFTTKAIPLCDIFDLGFTVFSVGDPLFYIGLAVILVGVVKKLNK